MLNNEEDFKNLIGRLNIDDKPIPSHKETLRAQMLTLFNASRQKDSQITINTQTFWRTIMKSRITKLAAAAVIMITIGLLAYHHTGSIDGTSVAWALQDTFKELDQIRTLAAEGKDWSGRKLLLWAQVDESGAICKWRIEEPDIHYFIISTESKSYEVRTDSNYVRVSSGPLITGKIRIRSFFEDIGQAETKLGKILYGAENVDIRTEQRAEETVIVCSYVSKNKKTTVEIDPETKLPKRLFLEGEPMPGELFKEIYTFHYNIPMPEETFTFDIRDGMKVNDIDNELKILADPNNGIDFGNISKATKDNNIHINFDNDLDLARVISEQYCKAVMAGKMEFAKRLYPFQDAMLPQIINQSAGKIEHYNIGKAWVEGGCGYGPIVQCEFLFTNGTGKRFNLIVKFFNEKEGKRAVIVSVWDLIVDIKSSSQAK
jgi:hypothetical protein